MLLVADDVPFPHATRAYLLERAVSNTAHRQADLGTTNGAYATSPALIVAGPVA